MACMLFLLAGIYGPVWAQWAAQPGERVRNSFGPSNGSAVRECRGACGVGCPSSCRQEVEFECLPENGLRRVRVFECGTHDGCREHDDCLDRCSRNRPGFDCSTECHADALEEYGFTAATSWATGGGPFDPDPIRFEYTRGGPDSPEPVYRCPGGSTRRCDGEIGGCVAADGSAVPPVFDRFPTSLDGALRISEFRSGRLCDGSGGPEVCDETPGIRATQAEDRYGFEFVYENADPAVPMNCSLTGEGDGEDFIGGLVAGALRSMPEKKRDTDFGALLGHLQDSLNEGGSLKEALSEISVTPHGAGSPPVDGEGSSDRSVAEASPRVPRAVRFDRERGRMVVPLSGTAEAGEGSSSVEREVRCSYKGIPVLETSFRLEK